MSTPVTTAATSFDRLNSQHRAAARFGFKDASGTWQAGPLLTIAGAGTGKTNTLAHRVAHLVMEKVRPERILLLTFTRRAALEMCSRAQRIVGAALAASAGRHLNLEDAVRLPWSGTFHSVANRLIRRHCARLGLDESFSVMDRADAADLLDLTRHELGFSSTERRFPRKDTCLAIYSHRVNTRRSLRTTLDKAFPWCAEWEAELTRLFAAYVERKIANQALDYDDLLLYWNVMMEEAPLAAEIGAMFDHILVDEYQDTNAIQADIVRRLRPDGAGVMVVGDDAQSIYAFRGAAIENILSFPAQYEPRLESRCQVIALEENYRSTQAVLDAANALMAESSRAYRKALQSTRSEGKRPRYVSVADEQAQAEYVVASVLEARERGTLLRSQSVLFRSSHHSDALELELVRRNIPYVKYGGLKFLEAAHVKDLLAVLRWADNPKNRVAAFRVLQLLPGLGPRWAERVFTRFEAASFAWASLAPIDTPSDGWPQFAKLMTALAQAETPWAGQVMRVREWYEPHLERLYDEPGVRAADLVQLERISGQYETREEFLTELALDPPSGTSDRAGDPLLDEDFLILSTVHSAKGQEWDAVHVLNVTDGTFPNEFATGDEGAIEEERRLLYVAMTRAKTDLSLIVPLKFYASQQSRMGDRHVYGARSRFLTSSVMACFEEVVWPAGQLSVKEPSAPAPRIDVAGRLKSMWA